MSGHHVTVVPNILICSPDGSTHSAATSVGGSLSANGKTIVGDSAVHTSHAIISTVITCCTAEPVE